jgi:hypothetical protein
MGNPMIPDRAGFRVLAIIEIRTPHSALRNPQVSPQACPNVNDMN